MDTESKADFTRDELVDIFDTAVKYSQSHGSKPPMISKKAFRTLEDNLARQEYLDSILLLPYNNPKDAAYAIFDKPEANNQQQYAAKLVVAMKKLELLETMDSGTPREWFKNITDTEKMVGYFQDLEAHNLSKANAYGLVKVLVMAQEAIVGSIDARLLGMRRTLASKGTATGPVVVKKPRVDEKRYAKVDSWEKLEKEYEEMKASKLTDTQQKYMIALGILVHCSNKIPTLTKIKIKGRCDLEDKDVFIDLVEKTINVGNEAYEYDDDFAETVNAFVATNTSIYLIPGERSNKPMTQENLNHYMNAIFGMSYRDMKHLYDIVPDDPVDPIVSEDGGKTYVCPRCGKKYKTAGGVRRHLDTKHGKEPE